METLTKMDNDINESIKLCTLRFNLSKDLTDELMYFSKLHEFDDRKAFKEAWIKWKENENNKILLDLLCVPYFKNVDIIFSNNEIYNKIIFLIPTHINYNYYIKYI